MLAYQNEQEIVIVHYICMYVFIELGNKQMLLTGQHSSWQLECKLASQSFRFS